ncbi:MAG: glycosyltransferase, partial [Burkholderiales bacterium]|nr:glycosyltransferase [Flavobacterium sp.]
GAKGKLIEAMQCGTPSVTTAIGAESMQGSLSWNGLIAEDAQEIANAAVQLYRDEILWKQSQQNGIAIVNSRYSKSLFAEDFVRRVLIVQSNLAEFRQNNFIGSVLMHHLHAGTKYMSKWIAEKNKKNKE